MYNSSEQPVIPWMMRSEIGFFRAVIRTIFQAFFRPVKFFDHLSKQYSLEEALRFACVLYIALPLSMALVVAVVIGIKDGAAGLYLLFAATIGIVIGGAVTILLILIIAAILHIFVLIFMGKGGYSGTFNIVIYTLGAIVVYTILMLIIMLTSFLLALLGPSVSKIVGLPIAIFQFTSSIAVWLWLIVVIITGYKAIHRMGTLRAIATLIAPLVLIAMIFLFIALPHIKEIKQSIKNIRSIKPGAVAIKIPQKIAIPQLLLMASGEINWNHDLSSALGIAERQGKPLMVDFYTDWCGWCKRLDEDTYSDQAVRALSENFICVKVNADKDRAATGRYNVSGYPTIVFLTPNGNVADKIVGYVNAERMATTMKAVASKYVPKSMPSKLGSIGSPKTKEGDYKLSAILASSGKIRAVVNDTITKVGDEIGDAKVVEIGKNNVTLLRKGAKVVLYMKEEQ